MIFAELAMRGQLVEPRIGHGDAADIGLDGAERIVGRLRRLRSAVSALNRVDLPTLGRPTMPQLKPMSYAFDSSARRLRRRREKRHPAHVSFVDLAATLGQQRRLRRPARRAPWAASRSLAIALVGLEIAQHPVQHEVLVAGMADADAHAAIVVAEMGIDVADAVVAAGAAALLDADLARRQVELVVEHHDVGRAGS